MRKCREILSAALAVVMVFTLIAVAPVSAQAKAKKPALVKSKVTLTVGKSSTIKIKNRPRGTTVSYSSSKKAVATVTKKGKVTAKKAGSATIIVSIKKKKKNVARLKYKVTVKRVITLTDSEGIIKINDSVLTRYYKPGDTIDPYGQYKYADGYNETAFLGNDSIYKGTLSFEITEGKDSVLSFGSTAASGTDVTFKCLSTGRARIHVTSSDSSEPEEDIEIAVINPTVYLSDSYKRDYAIGAAIKVSDLFTKITDSTVFTVTSGDGTVISRTSDTDSGEKTEYTTLSAGDATIKATDADGTADYGSVTVHVHNPMTRYSEEKPFEAELEPGTSFNAAILTEYSNKDIGFIQKTGADVISGFDGSNVLTQDENGMTMISTIKPGRSRIQITDRTGTADYGTAVIEVKAPEVKDYSCTIGTSFSGSHIVDNYSTSTVNCSFKVIEGEDVLQHHYRDSYDYDNDGAFTALKAGTAKVQVSSDDEEGSTVYGIATVTVTPEKISDYQMGVGRTVHAYDIYDTDEFTNTETAYTDDKYQKKFENIAFRIASGNDVLTQDEYAVKEGYNAEFKSLKAGTATIEVTDKDGTTVYGTSTITVNNPQARNGVTFPIGATISPADIFDYTGENTVYAVTSGTNAVAQIGYVGVGNYTPFRTLKAGTAKIVAKDKDSGKTYDTATVTVKNPQPVSDSVTVGLGESISADEISDYINPDTVLEIRLGSSIVKKKATTSKTPEEVFAATGTGETQVHITDGAGHDFGTVKVTVQERTVKGGDFLLTDKYGYKYNGTVEPVFDEKPLYYDTDEMTSFTVVEGGDVVRNGLMNDNSDWPEDASYDNYPVFKTLKAGRAVIRATNQDGTTMDIPVNVLF